MADDLHEEGLPPLHKGTLVGRYVVLEELGAGAMGRVYAAFDPDLDRRVALKLVGATEDVPPSDLSREARVLAKLVHPNVATVYDVGWWKHGLFIAMELVAGGDLCDWLGAERTPTETITALVEAGRGLAAAHDRGVVHRDFKPSNVLVGTDGRVRVADFGLARLSAEVQGGVAAGDSLRGLVVSGRSAVAGTPDFMAPETLNYGIADALSDQYSYCVAFHWALCGELPGDGGPRRLPVPARVRTAIRRGLDSDPQHRFPDMRALLAAVDGGRRRSRFVVGAAVGTVGGALAVFAATHPDDHDDHDDPDARCRDGLESYADTWSRGRSEALARQLGSADTIYAADTGRRATAALDLHSEVWRSAYASACADPHDGVASCLEAVQGQTQAVIAALERGGPETIEHAVAVVAQLPAPARCRTHPQRVRAPVASPEQADAVARAWTTSRLADAMEQTGQFDAALHSAQEVFEDAGRHDDLPLQARAGLTAGLAHVGLGNYDEAQTALRSAFIAAWTADDDLAAVEIAAELVSVVGQRQGDERLGEVWRDLGLAAVERMNTASAAQADFWDATGSLAAAQGRWDEARQLYDRGLEMRRELFDRRHPDIALSLYNLATLDYDEGKLDSGIRRSELVLQLRIDTFGDQHPEVAMARNGVGAGLLQRGQVDRAIEQLEQALEQGTSALGPRHPRLAAIRTNLANAFNRKGDHSRAEVLYLEVLETWTRTRGNDDPSVALAHYNVASTAFRAGDLDEASRHFETAVSIWRATVGAEHPRVATGLAGMATVLMTLGDCEGAVEHSQRAASILAATKEPGARIVPVLHTLSRAHHCLGHTERASAAIDSALESGRRVYGEDNPSLAALYVHLASVEFSAERVDEASAAAERALELGGTTDVVSTAKFILARTLVDRDLKRAVALAREAAAGLPRNARFEYEHEVIRRFIENHPVGDDTTSPPSRLP